MRNLEITRQKSFVGCLGTMKVYIEDPFSSEITISGVPCRLLGTLKNGEQKTFSVDDEAHRIFVIADKLSKDVFCESYPIPAGTEDIHLTGKNHYNPAAGNPFYFDGNTDPEALAARKKGKHIGTILLICLIGVALVTVFGAVLGGLTADFLLNRKSADKVFTSGEMLITLTEEFAEAEYMGYQAVYRSPKTMVFVVKDSFSLYPQLRSMSLREYGEAVIANNKRGNATIKTEKGITYFEYKATADGNEYNYFTVLYRSDEAFWIVQFTTNAKDASKMRSDIIRWAQSVAFTK